jgi:hypothetical protein
MYKPSYEIQAIKDWEHHRMQLAAFNMDTPKEKPKRWPSDDIGYDIYG